MSIKEKIGNTIRNLFPGYFALVMSTGIVGNSAITAGLHFLGEILFYINIVSFVILILFYFARFIAYFREFKSDFLTFEKSPGFLTIVAGSGVMGVEVIMIAGEHPAAGLLWLFGIVMWSILMMTFFVFVIITPQKPVIAEGLNGIWLLLVVSTQSIAILGNEFSHNLSGNMEVLLKFDLMLFMLGTFLYFVIIILILYRLVFFPVKPGESDHTYWIDAGAAAISVLSGLTFIEKAPSSADFTSLFPFVKGLTLMLWIIATWWIPLMVVIEIWRYFIRKVPVKYSPVQWSMIFAIGTYSLATMKTGQSISIPAITAAGKIFLYLALLLWLLTFSGLLSSMLKKSR